jgi:hypothetical protein
MVNRHRGIGWESLHVAVDDASRLAYTEILPDERKASAIAFLERALAWFARHGVTLERIMTDNGNAYRSHDFRAACTSAGVRHLRTRPYTPRTNGKAERFLQPSCVDAPTPAPSDHNRSGPPRWPRWLHLYNVHRPHTALAGQPPISRLAMNNLRQRQLVGPALISALLGQQPLDAGQRLGEVFGNLRPALELAPDVAKDPTRVGLEVSDLASGALRMASVGVAVGQAVSDGIPARWSQSVVILHGTSNLNV